MSIGNLNEQQQPQPEQKFTRQTTKQKRLSIINNFMMNEKLSDIAEIAKQIK